MNAPGSPSSALQQTYFWSETELAANCHLVPVGKPAPPRPRRPEALMVSMTCCGVISVRTLARALYPSKAMYSSMRSGSMTPQLRSATRFCFL